MQHIHAYLPELRSGKRFQASGMIAVDSPHKITPIWVIIRIFEKKISGRKNMKKRPNSSFLYTFNNKKLSLQLQGAQKVLELLQSSFSETFCVI
jgi:hypothetical protein